MEEYLHRLESNKDVHLKTSKIHRERKPRFKKSSVAKRKKTTIKIKSSKRRYTLHHINQFRVKKKKQQKSTPPCNNHNRKLCVIKSHQNHQATITKTTNHILPTTILSEIYQNSCDKSWRATSTKRASRQIIWKVKKISDKNWFANFHRQ